MHSPETISVIRQLDQQALATLTSDKSEAEKQGEIERIVEAREIIRERGRFDLLRAAIRECDSFYGLRRWWVANASAIFSLDRADYLTILDDYTTRREVLADKLVGRAQ